MFDDFAVNGHSIRPELTKYQVVVSNYNGEPWSDALNADFDKLLKEGKIGFVVVHAANNAFSPPNSPITSRARSTALRPAMPVRKKIASSSDSTF